MATYSSPARPRAISRARTSRSPRTGGIALKMSTTQSGARQTSTFLDPQGKASVLAPQIPLPSSRPRCAPPVQRPPSLAHIEAVGSRTGFFPLLRNFLRSTKSECPWDLRSAHFGVRRSHLDHRIRRGTCSSSSVLRTVTRRSRLGVESYRFAPSDQCTDTTVTWILSTKFVPSNREHGWRSLGISVRLLFRGPDRPAATGAVSSSE